MINIHMHYSNLEWIVVNIHKNNVSNLKNRFNFYAEFIIYWIIYNVFVFSGGWNFSLPDKLTLKKSLPINFNYVVCGRLLATNRIFLLREAVWGCCRYTALISSQNKLLHWEADATKESPCFFFHKVLYFDRNRRNGYLYLWLCAVASPQLQTVHPRLWRGRDRGMEGGIARWWEGDSGTGENAVGTLREYL